MEWNSDFISSLFTAISGVASAIAIWLTTSQFANSKKNDVKHFWYREFLVLNELEEYNNIFDKISKLIYEKEKNYSKTLLELKDCFEKLREIFYKTEFFDKVMFNKVYEFLNMCEQECLINSNLSKEEVLKMSNILLKSLYLYELNEYENFEIKY